MWATAVLFSQRLARWASFERTGPGAGRPTLVPTAGDEPRHIRVPVELRHSVPGCAGNGFRMQEVFKRPARRHKSSAAWSLIEEGGGATSNGIFRRKFPVVQMQFRTAEGQQAVCPGKRASAAEGKKNQPAFPAQVAEIGNGWIAASEDLADGLQE
jgi:hypothetical protein